MKVRNPEYLKAFGDNLEKLIKKAKITPEEVAAHGNIETKQVYRAINAERSITLSTLVAIAKGLNVPPIKLLDFDFKFEE